jgi:membrane peptidoglycan carboxypeptidase
MAVGAAVVTLIVFGVLLLVVRSDPEPANPPLTTPDTTVTTSAPAAVPEPSVIILGDGTEVASLTETGPSISASNYQTLVGYAVRELESNPDFNPERRTGLTVQLTVEPDVQQIVESVIEEWRDEPGAFITVVVMDNSNGAILAAAPASGVPSDVFYPERLLPAASLAEVYTTIAALEAGYTLDSEWDGSSPQTFTRPDWQQEWTVGNAGSSYPSIPLDQALYNSVNTVFAGIAMDIGPDPIIDAAARLGVNLAGLENVPLPPDLPIHEFLPLEAVATGQGEITTFDAAAMFATISHGGVLTPPVIIQTITDASGDVIYQTLKPTERTVDAAVVEEIRQPLAVVPISGTAPRANLATLLGRPVDQIGKTGTAPNYLTAWYVGSTYRYTAAISVGRLDTNNQLVPLVELDFNGQRYERVFGGSIPAPIWAEIMAKLVALP